MTLDAIAELLAEAHKTTLILDKIIVALCCVSALVFVGLAAYLVSQSSRHDNGRDL